VLLDGGGEDDFEAGVVRERGPASGGSVDGEWLALAAEFAVYPRDVFGEEDVIVLPLGSFIDPKTPVIVGDQHAVLRIILSVRLHGEQAMRIVGKAGSSRSDSHRLEQCATREVGLWRHDAESFRNRIGGFQNNSVARNDEWRSQLIHSWNEPSKAG